MRRALLTLSFLLVATTTWATSITFQEGVSSYSGTNDTSIWQDNPTSNYGTLTAQRLQAEFSTHVSNVLLSFDVTSITTPVTVNSCSMTVWLNMTSSSGAKTLKAYQGCRSWGETTATWSKWNGTNNWATAGAASTDDACSDNAASTGADRRTTQTGSVAIAGFDPSGTKTITLTPSLCQGWINRSIPNNGLLLGFPVTTTGTDAWTMDFSEHATTSHHPTLTIDYTAGTTVRKRMM